MLVSTSTLAGGLCDELRKFIALPGSVHFTCQKNTGVYFGYDLQNKRSQVAIYDVLSTPYSEYVINQGMYSAIDDLSIEKQADPRRYLNEDFDVGYLVAPYLFLTSSDQAVQGFTVANALPIPKKTWRGNFNKASFNIDKIEREMFSDKGHVVAVYGVISNKESGDPTHIYRVYYQPQYQLSIAFLLPLSLDISTSPNELITSIDCIESLAGVELLPYLDKGTQSDIKNKKALNTELWARKDGNGELSLCD